MAVERPRAGLWTVCACACALAAASVAAIAASSVDRWARARPAAPAGMVVYLGEGVPEARGAVVARELSALPGVARAELVSAAESARRLLAALGPEPALLEGIDPASLPASVEVEFEPGVRDVVALSPSVRALRGAAGVADVVIDGADDGSARILAAARALAWGGAALLSGLALAGVLAAIRVRLGRGERELAVARLLGAGPGFLAVPAALAGALTGLGAAVLAAIAVGLGLHRYGGALGPHLAAPGAAELAALLAAGALLGGLAGGLAGAPREQR
jgi:cell division protein FtsX